MVLNCGTAACSHAACHWHQTAAYVLLSRLAAYLGVAHLAGLLRHLTWCWHWSIRGRLRPLCYASSVPDSGPCLAGLRSASWNWVQDLHFGMADKAEQQTQVCLLPTLKACRAPAAHLKTTRKIGSAWQGSGSGAVPQRQGLLATVEMNHD